MIKGQPAIKNGVCVCACVFVYALQGYHLKGDVECAAEHYKEAIESFKVIIQLVLFAVIIVIC